MTVDDAALYTNSTIALRPDDGSLAWYFQHVPGETLDLDEVFERVLVDVAGRPVVFSVGKHGISRNGRDRKPTPPEPSTSATSAPVISMQVWARGMTRSPSPG